MMFNKKSQVIPEGNTPSLLSNNSNRSPAPAIRNNFELSGAEWEKKALLVDSVKKRFDELDRKNTGELEISVVQALGKELGIAQFQVANPPRKFSSMIKCLFEEGSVFFCVDFQALRESFNALDKDHDNLLKGDERQKFLQENNIMDYEKQIEDQIRFSEYFVFRATRRLPKLNEQETKSQQEVAKRARSVSVVSTCLGEYFIPQETVDMENFHQKDNTKDQSSVHLKRIPVSWSPHVPQGAINSVLTKWKPLKRWTQRMNRNASLNLHSIHIKSVDMFGPNPGFVEFKMDVSLAGRGQPDIQLPDSHLFMRGDAVGILVILICDGEEHTILTVQARIPVGMDAFPEIPAGMLNESGTFGGQAAKELKEETGIIINENDLIPLTTLAFGDSSAAMIPAPKTCDEEIKLYACRLQAQREQLNVLTSKIRGKEEEGERIWLRVVPLADLWQIAPDSKSLSALVLYQQLKESGQLLRYPIRDLLVKD